MAAITASICAPVARAGAFSPRPLRRAATGSIGGTMGARVALPRARKSCVEAAVRAGTRCGSQSGFLGGKGLGVSLPARRTGAGSRRVVRMQYRPSERAIAAFPYILPLLDGIRYGRFFFQEFPASVTVLQPLMPVITVYNQVPFAGLILFFSLYYGIVNNQNFVRYVRVNCMQAVLIDILLILPGLIENVWRPPASGFGLQVYITFYNTIWLYVSVCVVYAVGSCIAGQLARLPGVADAAEAQVR